MKDLFFMTSEQRRRQTVLPGLTGWAQIKGRNNLTWEKKFKYDLEYIDNINFFRDCNIILKTIKKVIDMDGISQNGFDTGEDFGDYLLNEKKISPSLYEKIIKKGKEKYQNE